MFINKNSIQIASVLLAFVTLLCVLIISWATKSVPLWFYVVVSGATGVVLVSSIMFFSKQDKNRWIIYLLIILFGFSIWNFFALATNYDLIAFNDSYTEMVNLRLILDNGHINSANDYSNLVITPGESVNYPVFSSLAATFALATGFEAITIGTVLPIIVTVFSLFSLALFLNRLLQGSKIKNVVLPIALIVYLIAPSMLSDSVFFYHRELAFSFSFLLLYFLIKYVTGEIKTVYRIMFVALLFLLPFTHSSTPYTFLTFLLTFVCLIFIARIIGKYKPNFALSFKIPVAAMLLLFGACFLWNFMLINSSSVSDGFTLVARNIFTNLFKPQIETRLSEAIATSAAVPEVLRPLPWIILPQIRSFLLDVPLIIVSVFLAYRLLSHKASNNEVIALLFILAFVPRFVLGILSWWNIFIYRIYMFPMIAFSAGLLYGSILNYKTRILKALSYSIIVFLIVIALLAPFGSVYSRQLYDPTVTYTAADFPNPSYINIKELTNRHQFGDGAILSDFVGLLTVVLPTEQYTRIDRLSDKYGASNTYIVAFLELQAGSGVGDNWDPAVEKISNETALIRSTINDKYNLLVDAGPYTVYFKP